MHQCALYNPKYGILYNSNIFYCIQYDKDLTIVLKTIAQILELKNGNFQINLVSIQDNHFIIMKVSVLVWIFFYQSTHLRIHQYNVILPLITKLINNSFFLSLFFDILKNILEIQNPVSDCSLMLNNSAIFQLYHGENKIIFIEMMMRSALY